jgi:hypothetical protein
MPHGKDRRVLLMWSVYPRFRIRRRMLNGPKMPASTADAILADPGLKSIYETVLEKDCAIVTASPEIKGRGK